MCVFFSSYFDVFVAACLNGEQAAAAPTQELKNVSFLALKMPSKMGNYALGISPFFQVAVV